MTVVRAQSFSVDMAGVKSVTLKGSLTSYIPKLVGAVMLLVAIYLAASFFGQMSPGFRDGASLWEKIGGVIMLLIVLGIALALAGSSLVLLISDADNADTMLPIKWILSIAAFIIISGSAMNYSGAATVSETGGSFGDNYQARSEFIASQKQEADVGVLITFGLVAAFLTLGLTGRKDVYLHRVDGIQKLSNISKEDAVVIMNSLAAL